MCFIHKIFAYVCLNVSWWGVDFSTRLALLFLKFPTISRTCLCSGAREFVCKAHAEQSFVHVVCAFICRHVCLSSCLLTTQFTATSPRAMEISCHNADTVIRYQKLCILDLLQDFVDAYLSKRTHSSFVENDLRLLRWKSEQYDPLYEYYQNFYNPYVTLVDRDCH